MEEKKRKLGFGDLWDKCRGQQDFIDSLLDVNITLQHENSTLQHENSKLKAALNELRQSFATGSEETPTAPTTSGPSSGPGSASGPPPTPGYYYLVAINNCGRSVELALQTCRAAAFPCEYVEGLL